MNIVKVEILDKEISRKQFLQIIAGASLGLFGINNLLSMLRLMSDKPQATDSTHGFGSRKFGE